MDQRRRKSWIAALAVLAGAIALWSLGPRAAEPAVQGPDVVVLRCATAGGGRVAAYQRSAGAPSKKSDTCPQALADLGREGFGVQQAAWSDDVETLVVVLARSAGR